MMHGQNQPLEQTPHLGPALTAVILGIVVLEAFGLYARSLEYRSITALAADEAIIERFGKLAPVKNQGTPLQEAALDTGGLLPVYGSSELNLQAAYNRPFHSTNLFRDRPTGFTIFPVGKAGTTCLIMLQKLAAVRPRTRRAESGDLPVAISGFSTGSQLGRKQYVGNFSDLHAGDLAFNTGLSLQLRQDAARRMLQFPATVANRPLLKFALENLADGSPLSLACYDAVLPLGIMHNVRSSATRITGPWCVISGNIRQKPRPRVLRRSGPLDWPALHRQAEALYRAHSNNNEFGHG